MFYIKLDTDMNLTITVREPLYRGDNLNRKIIYLVPVQIGEIDMLTAYVYLNYVRADGVADVAVLERMDKKYNESYYQYTFPVTCKLTKYPGEICTWMTVYTGNPSCPTVSTSGECMLQIRASQNMDDCLCDHHLTALYQIQKHMEEKLAELGESVDAVASGKADNIVFHPEDSTLQLTANGVPIGDRILVSAKGGPGIIFMEISVDGELLVTFEDGGVRNLGRVVGKDGAVYVPHIDKHSVLTFTIEENASGVPAPVDLNPNDEWSSISDESDSRVVTDYIWESIESN